MLNHINSPDILSLQGANVKVLSAGRVLDRSRNGLRADSRGNEQGGDGQRDDQTKNTHDGLLS